MSERPATYEAGQIIYHRLSHRYYAGGVSAQYYSSFVATPRTAIAAVINSWPQNVTVEDQRQLWEAWRLGGNSTCCLCVIL